MSRDPLRFVHPSSCATDSCAFRLVGHVKKDILSPCPKTLDSKPIALILKIFTGRQALSTLKILLERRACLG